MIKRIKQQAPFILSRLEVHKAVTAMLFGCALCLTLLSGCSSIETLTAWAGDKKSVMLVRVATSEVIYQKGEREVCNRSFRVAEAAGEVRSIINNDVLALNVIDKQVAAVIQRSGVSPFTAAILLDVGKDVVAKHADMARAGAISSDARITLNGLLDAVLSTAIIAGDGCE